MNDKGGQERKTMTGERCGTSNLPVVGAQPPIDLDRFPLADHPDRASVVPGLDDAFMLYQIARFCRGTPPLEIFGRTANNQLAVPQMQCDQRLVHRIPKPKRNVEASIA